MTKVCLAAALVVMLSVPVLAQDKPDQVLIESKVVEVSHSKHELGIDLFNQDTRGALPKVGPTIQTFDGSVLGLQLTYAYFLSNWFLLGSLGYGLGNQTFKTSPPFSQEDQYKLAMMVYGAGLGYIAPITDRVRLRTTLQMLYSTTSSTLKFAGTEEDGPSYNSLGLAVALGAAYEFAERYQFRTELYNLYSYGWIDEDDAEILEWVKFSCYRVGVSREF